MKDRYFEGRFKDLILKFIKSVKRKFERMKWGTLINAWSFSCNYQWESRNNSLIECKYCEINWNERKVNRNERTWKARNWENLWKTYWTVNERTQIINFESKIVTWNWNQIEKQRNRKICWRI